MGTTNDGEKEFIYWLNQNDLPFLYVEQSVETFASRHFVDKIKRPDFHIVIQGLGVIAVDVKCQKFNDGYKTFTINHHETNKLKNYSTNFNIPIWLVFASRFKDIDAWHWINVNQVEKVAESRQNSKDNQQFYSIEVKDCKTLGITDRLAKILI